jgi:hypothetical protein
LSTAQTRCTLLAVLIVGCGGSDLLPPSDGFLAVGTWGGENSGVIVTDSATHVHVGCTFGDMPGSIALDASGRFTVDGSYVLRAYPVQMGPSLRHSSAAEWTGKAHPGNCGQ